MSVFKENAAVNSLAPKVFIDKVTLESTRVKASLIIQQELYDPSNIGTSTKDTRDLINNNELLKYLLVYVVCSKGGMNLLANDEMYFKKAIVSDKYDKNRFDVIAYSIADFSLSRLTTRQDSGQQYRGLSLSHDFYTTEEDNLCVFAFSHFDTKKLALDTGVPLNLMLSQALSYGPLTDLSVFKNGQIDAKATSLFDTLSQQWTAPYHYHEWDLLSDNQIESYILAKTDMEKEKIASGFLASIVAEYNSRFSGFLKNLDYDSEGVVPPDESEYLEKRLIQKQSVSDFRIVDRVESFQLDLSFIEKDLAPRIQRLGSQKEVQIRKNPAFFGELWSSRNFDGTYGFSSVLDLYAVMEENSIFSPLIKKMRTDGMLNSVFNNYELIKPLDISVFRRKVTTTRGISNPLNSLSITPEENSVLELLVDAKEQKTPVRLESGKDYGLPPEKSLISFQDYKISEKQSGNYQYIIEMTFQDKMFDVLGETLEVIILNRDKIFRFFNECSKLGTRKGQDSRLENTVGFTSAHIEVADPGFGEEFLEGNYDPVSNKFTQSWAQNGQMAFEFIVEYIYDYVSIMTWLTDLQDSDAIIDSLIRITSPDTGNPRGVLTLIKLHDDLIASLKLMLKVTTNKTKDNAGTVDPKEQKSLSGTVSRVFKIRKEFSEIVSLNEENGYAYDYLNPQFFNESPDYSTMATFSPSFLINRASRETLEYFNNIDQQISLQVTTGDFAATVINPNDSLRDNYLSYLAPASIISPKSKFDFFSVSWNDLSFLNTEIKILFSNLMKFDLNPTNDYNSIVDQPNILNNLEFVEKIFPSLLGLGIPSTKTKLGDAFAGTTFTTETISETGDRSIKDPISPVDKANSSLPKTKVDPVELRLLLRMLQRKITNKGFMVLDQKVTRFENFDPVNWNSLADPFPSLPNQIKALYLSFSSPASVNVKRSYQDKNDPFTDLSNTGAAFRLHYMNLAKIEYLSGFSNDAGTNRHFIKDPKWELLRDFQITEGDRLLCRLVPDTKNANYELPIYNKYFIIDKTLGIGVDPPIIAATAGEFTTLPVANTVAADMEMFRQQVDGVEILNVKQAETSQNQLSLGAGIEIAASKANLSTSVGTLDTVGMTSEQIQLVNSAQAEQMEKQKKIVRSLNIVADKKVRKRRINTTGNANNAGSLNQGPAQTLGVIDDVQSDTSLISASLSATSTDLKY